MPAYVFVLDRKCLIITKITRGFVERFVKATNLQICLTKRFTTVQVKNTTKNIIIF